MAGLGPSSFWDAPGDPIKFLDKSLRAERVSVGEGIICLMMATEGTVAGALDIGCIGPKIPSLTLDAGIIPKLYVTATATTRPVDLSCYLDWCCAVQAEDRPAPAAMTSSVICWSAYSRSGISTQLKLASVVPVAAGDRYVGVSVGSPNACVWLLRGSLQCWRLDSMEITLGTMNFSTIKTALPAGAPLRVRNARVGWEATCVVFDDTSSAAPACKTQATCFGVNPLGEFRLGQTSTTDPLPAEESVWVTPPAGSCITDAFPGPTSSCFVYDGLITRCFGAVEMAVSTGGLADRTALPPARPRLFTSGQQRFLSVPISVPVSGTGSVTFTWGRSPDFFYPTYELTIFGWSSGSVPPILSDLAASTYNTVTFTVLADDLVALGSETRMTFTIKRLDRAGNYERNYDYHGSEIAWVWDYYNTNDQRDSNIYNNVRQEVHLQRPPLIDVSNPILFFPIVPPPPAAAAPEPAAAPAAPLTLDFTAVSSTPLGPYSKYSSYYYLANDPARNPLRCCFGKADPADPWPFAAGEETKSAFVTSISGVTCSGWPQLPAAAAKNATLLGSLHLLRLKVGVATDGTTCADSLALITDSPLILYYEGNITATISPMSSFPYTLKDGTTADMPVTLVVTGLPSPPASSSFPTKVYLSTSQDTTAPVSFVDLAPAAAGNSFTLTTSGKTLVVAASVAANQGNFFEPLWEWVITFSPNGGVTWVPLTAVTYNVYFPNDMALYAIVPSYIPELSLLAPAPVTLNVQYLARARWVSRCVLSALLPNGHKQPTGEPDLVFPLTYSVNAQGAPSLTMNRPAGVVAGITLGVGAMCKLLISPDNGDTYLSTASWERYLFIYSVTASSPPSGPFGAATTVTVTGANIVSGRKAGTSRKESCVFWATPGAALAAVGGRNETSASANRAGTVMTCATKFDSPALAASRTSTLTVSIGVSFTAEAMLGPDKFVFYPPPLITAVSPAFLPAVLANTAPGSPAQPYAATGDVTLTLFGSRFGLPNSSPLGQAAYGYNCRKLAGFTARVAGVVNVSGSAGTPGGVPDSVVCLFPQFYNRTAWLHSPGPSLPELSLNFGANFHASAARVTLFKAAAVSPAMSPSFSASLGRIARDVNVAGSNLPREGTAMTCSFVPLSSAAAAAAAVPGANSSSFNTTGAVLKGSVVRCPLVASPATGPYRVAIGLVGAPHLTGSTTPLQVSPAPAPTQATPALVPSDGRALVVTVSGAWLLPEPTTDTQRAAGALLNATYFPLGTVRCLFGEGTWAVSTNARPQSTNTTLLCPLPDVSLRTGVTPLAVSVNAGWDYIAVPGGLVAYSALAAEPGSSPVAGGATTVISVVPFSLIANIAVGVSACVWTGIAGTPYASWTALTPVTSVAAPLSATCAIPRGPGLGNVNLGFSVSGLAIAADSVSAPFTYYAEADLGAGSPALQAPSNLVIPPGGPSSGSTPVRITLVSIPAGAQPVCVFGSTISPATVVNATAANTTLTCLTPSASGVVPAAVSFNGGVNKQQVGTFSYYTIFSFSPSSGPLTGGTLIEITGSGFIPGLTMVCSVGPFLAPAVYVSSSTVRCALPTTTAAKSRFAQLQQQQQQYAVQVGVVVLPSSAAAANSSNFTASSLPLSQVSFGVVSGQLYLSFPQPVALSMIPSFDFTGGGRNVTVVGTDFGPGLSCRFSGAVVRATVLSATTAVCVAPTSAPGPAAVSLSRNDVDYSPPRLDLFTFRQCAPGHFAKVDTDPCQPCDPGFYALRSGSQVCEPCGQLAYAELPATSNCTSCPPNSYISVAVSDQRSKCHCKQGFYSPALPNGTVPAGGSDDALGCLPCPDGAECAGAEAQPIAKKGYWADQLNPHVFLECKAGEKSCPGGGVSVCGPGTFGRLCSECAKGFYKLGAGCGKCSRWAPLLMIGFILALLAAAVAVLRLIGAEAGLGFSGTISVAMDYFQILGVLGSAPLKFPPPIQKAIRYISSPAFLSPDFLASECTFGKVTWPSKWIAIMSLPLVFALMFTFLWVLGILQGVIARRLAAAGGGGGDVVHKLGHDDDDGEGSGSSGGGGRMERLRWSLFAEPVNARDLRDRCMNGWNMVFNLEYMYLVTAVFSFFGCERLPDGKLTLSAEPSLLCTDPWWRQRLPIGVAAVVVYVIGQPLMAAIFIYRNRMRLRHPNFSRRFSSLYFEYRVEVPFWGSIEKVQKLLIGMVAAFLTPWPRLQSVLLLFLVLVTLLLQRGYRPMFDPRDDTLQTALNIAICLVLSAGMLFQTEALPFGAAKTIISVYVITVVVGGTVVIMWGVIATLRYQWSLERRSPGIEHAEKYLRKQMLCPSGWEVFEGYAKSPRCPKSEQKAMWRVFKSLRDESFEFTTYKAASLSRGEHLLDLYTSQVFSPVVLPGIALWLKRRIELVDAWVLGHMQRRQQRQEEEEEEEEEEGQSSEGTATATYASYYKEDDDDGREAVVEALEELLTFHTMFSGLAGFFRVRATLNMALPFQKVPETHPSPVPRIPTITGALAVELKRRHARLASAEAAKKAGKRLSRHQGRIGDTGDKGWAGLVENEAADDDDNDDDEDYNQYEQQAPIDLASLARGLLVTLFSVPEGRVLDQTADLVSGAEKPREKTDSIVGLFVTLMQVRSSLATNADEVLEQSGFHPGDADNEPSDVEDPPDSDGSFEDEFDDAAEPVAGTIIQAPDEARG